jgi:hypothetical protein
MNNYVRDFTYEDYDAWGKLLFRLPHLSQIMRWSLTQDTRDFELMRWAQATRVDDAQRLESILLPLRADTGPVGGERLKLLKCECAMWYCSICNATPEALRVRI